MLGLEDALVADCVATADCHGSRHRLVVRDHALVALDHQSEAAKVLDALTDEVPCLQLVAAWERTRWRYAHLGPNPFLSWLENLIPADVSPAEHEDWVQAEAQKARRFQALVAARQRGLRPSSPEQTDLADLLANAGASASVVRLPDPMRVHLGLLCAVDAVESESLDPGHADRLSSAVAGCVASWVELGYPSAPARVSVLDALRVPGSPQRRRGDRRTVTPF